MPLTGHCRQPVADQADALGDWAHETAFPELSAVEWMRQTIRRYPGEVTLLATGPLTNVGLLAALDPEATGMLRSLVIMGGRFGPVPPPRGDVEWNMRCDAVAAERTVTTPGCPLRAVGLDVTTRVTMPAEAVRKRFAAPVLEPVRDFAEIWFRRTDEVVFHDPLAAACVFDPSLCTWEAGTVEVELQSTRLAGHTTFTPAPDGAHRIARTVDAGRFLDHYFEIVRG
jgi:purine nucleosidase